MSPTEIVVPPSIEVQLFYSYYSSLSLGLTWLITPLLFYTILTHSSSLKSFKWLIINHSCWCLAWESLIGICKPVLLSPALAGYSIGFIRHDLSLNFHTIGYLIIFGFICSGNGITSLGASIACRYLLAFPSPWTKWINIKLVIILFTAITLSFNIGAIYIALTKFSLNESCLRKLAVTTYPSLQALAQESSFIFVPRDNIPDFALGVLIIQIMFIFIALSVVGFFIHLVKKHKQTKTTSKLQYFLIISSIVQIMITLGFCLIPLIVAYTVFAFNVPNSATIATLCFSMFSSHALFEFIATLYFVTPYRKFVKKLFFKVLRYFGVKRFSKVSKISEHVVTF